MIYFDNAATSLQKPREVTWAIQAAMRQAGGYGRSGHRPALRAGELVYECRELAAKLFGMDDPESVVFTMNATHALNQAIHSLVDQNTVAAITGYEHNSVVRPLTERNVPYIILQSGLYDDDTILQSAHDALEKGANLFIINHMSNVFGGIVPLEKLDALLYDAGVPMIVDASQSAGTMEIDVRKLRSVATICMPGHKGLLGPQGTGMLLVCSQAVNRPLMQGGTGSLSSDLHQPSILPDRFESGTPNVPGIAGLACGLRFILREGTAKIGQHERMLKDALARRLSQIDGTEIFYTENAQRQGGVLSFRHNRMPCEIVAERLSERGMCVRAGLHCAPHAHISAGTLDSGTVRASFGPYNTLAEVAAFGAAFGEIVD